MPFARNERITQPAIAGFARRYNAAPGQNIVVSIGGEMRTVRWGMLSPWRGHGGVRPPPIITAPLSAVATTPVLRRATRCGVPADGFYAKAKVGKAVHVWWIHGSTELVGLVGTSKDDGIESAALLTVPAPAALAQYTPQVFATPGEVVWRAREVSRWFEDIAHDDEQCIAGLGNPGQGELF
jgi:putative SOS response-associated peptidase YedK